MLLICWTTTVRCFSDLGCVLGVNHSLLPISDLNLLSWNSANVLAVALSQNVYLWDANTSTIKELMSVENTPNDYISSVAWIQHGDNHIALGTAESGVQSWDVQ